MWWKKRIKADLDAAIEADRQRLDRDLYIWKSSIEKEMRAWKYVVAQNVAENDKTGEERHKKHIARMEDHADQVEQYLFTQTNLVRALMEKLEK